MKRELHARRNLIYRQMLLSKTVPMISEEFEIPIDTIKNDKRWLEKNFSKTLLRKKDIEEFTFRVNLSSEKIEGLISDCYEQYRETHDDEMKVTLRNQILSLEQAQLQLQSNVTLGKLKLVERKFLHKK